MYIARPKGGGGNHLEFQKCSLFNAKCEKEEAEKECL